MPKGENKMNKFDDNLAKVMGVKKITGLDRFSLLSGVIGLIVDIGAIIGLAGGLVIPNLPVPEKIPAGGMLITAFLGFYSLTLIVWFLIRFERAKREKLEMIDSTSNRLFDSINEAMEGVVGILLIPLIGTWLIFFVYETMATSFLSVFISWLPVALWIYVSTSDPWLGVGVGLVVSIFFSQYATWFALVLDKFFH